MILNGAVGKDCCGLTRDTTAGVERNAVGLEWVFVVNTGGVEVDNVVDILVAGWF